MLCGLLNHSYSCTRVKLEMPPLFLLYMTWCKTQMNIHLSCVKQPVLWLLLTSSIPLYVGFLPTCIAKSSVLHLPALSPLPPVSLQAVNKQRQLDFLPLYTFNNWVNLLQNHPPNTTPRQWSGPVPTGGNLSNPINQYLI